MKASYLYIITALFLFSCNIKNKIPPVRNCDIEVFYIPGLINTSSPYTAKKMRQKMLATIPKDTIFVDDNVFCELNTLADSISTKNVRALPTYDGRIYVKWDSLEICIDTFNDCYNQHDKRLTINDKFIYILKCKSGYYNTLPKEYLEKYDRPIRRFGLPKDYVYKFNIDMISGRKLVIACKSGDLL